MGTIIFGVVSVFFLVLTEAQNASSPSDIINSIKSSFEAAGAGALKLGPMGLFGDMGGQFGLKVNKEQTTSAVATAVHAKTLHGGPLSSVLRPKREGMSMNLMQGRKNTISKKDMKSCGGRYGRTIIIPVIVSTTAATTTTTAATRK